MLYLDSSVVIAAYYPRDPHHKTCEKLMRDLSSGKDEGVISLCYEKLFIASYG